MLQSCLAYDISERQAGEALIATAKNTPGAQQKYEWHSYTRIDSLCLAGCALRLAEILQAQGHPVAVRQLAAVILRQMTDKQWETISSEEKAAVRATLPKALNESEARS